MYYEVVGDNMGILWLFLHGFRPRLEFPGYSITEQDPRL